MRHEQHEICSTGSLKWESGLNKLYPKLHVCSCEPSNLGFSSTDPEALQFFAIHMFFAHLYLS